MQEGDGDGTHVKADRPRCGAKCRDGHACLNSPMLDQTRCKMHGGKVPSHLAAAKRRRDRAQAEKVVARLGLPRDIHPDEALLEEVRRSAGAVAYLDGMVRELDPDAIVWGVTEKVTGIELRGDLNRPIDVNRSTEAAVVNVWVQLWQSERDRLAKVAKMALDAGIEQRRIELQEQVAAEAGRDMARVLNAIIGDREIGMTLEMQQLARKRAAAELRVIDVESRPLVEVGSGSS